MVAVPGICPVVIGPTGVGKTGLVTELAVGGDVEVISLDSRQVYRGLRIGTAQPTAAEQAVCPHHLVDFLPPTEKYDAVRFRADFARVHREIVGRGNRPILAGGASMYLKVLREGVMEIPGQTPERLRQVREELDAASDAEIRSQLAEVDPASAARLHSNDRYRNQRALEIYRLAGETMTSLVARQQPQPALGLEFPVFILQRPVAELDQRIARRTEAMLAAGWIEETEATLARYPAGCPGLRSIGYQEIVQFLTGETTRESLAASIVLATRQYAKRQRTWLRHIPAAGTWHPDDPALGRAVAEAGLQSD